MNKFDHKMNNQVMGLIPLFVFMLLDNYISYYSAFLISVGVCLFSLVLFYVMKRERIFLLMLLPTAVTLCLYSFLLFLNINHVLSDFSPLLIEIILVLLLAVVNFSKTYVLKKNREASHQRYKRTHIRTALNEFFFVVQLVQAFYTLHLFVVLVYTTMPESKHSVGMNHFLYHELGILIGVLLLIYEQIRLMMMKGSLQKEMWLPVLDDNLRVVGCIARSVARSLPKKYFHPIVRVVAISEGMIYIEKRSKEEYVSPDTYDSPFTKYILFRHSIASTVKEVLGQASRDKENNPRFLIRYIFENEKVKHLVYLHVICLPKQGRYIAYRKKPGRYWTPKQIEDNLHKGIFSEYFEKEFPYLKQTILYAEAMGNRPLHESDATSNVEMENLLSAP